MTPNTKKQISDLKIDPNLPVMIFDADEVLVHFAEPFAKYLKKFFFFSRKNNFRDFPIMFSLMPRSVNL